MTTRKVSASSGFDGPRLAFSYQRVSDPKQTRDGRAGLDRQADAFIGFCQRHSLIANADPLVDRGLSAFRGRHRSRGALGTFIAAAEAGQIPHGAVLVVEDLDRFSREAASYAEELLLALFNQGLALGIVRDDVVVDRARYDADMGLRVMLLTRREAAHDYSSKLSGRISDVWQRRQRDWIEHGKPYLGKGARPFWLADDGARFVEIPDAADLVRRMFRLSGKENMGCTQIAHLLNAEGIKPVRENAYGPTRLMRILRDRRVLGEKQWPDGSISADYFPRIVSDDEWITCQQAIERRLSNKGRHGRGEVIANLFQGGTLCPCGRLLYLQTGRNRSGQIAYAWLRCTGRRKGICTQPPGDWPYDEEALLLAFMSQRWSKFFDRPSDTRQRRALEKQIREQEAIAATHRQGAAAAEQNMAQLLQQGHLEASVAAMLGKAVNDAVAAAKAAEKRVQELQGQLQQISCRPTGKQLQQQIQERVKAFMACDRFDVAERRRFNNWFLGLGVRVTVLDPKLSRLQWGATEAVIYRDTAGNVISDETLGDMAVLGFSEDDIRKREAEIKAERNRAIAGQLTP